MSEWDCDVCGKYTPDGAGNYINDQQDRVCDACNADHQAAWKVVEFQVRVLVRDPQDGEAIMYNAFHDRVGSSWKRTSVKVLGE